MRRVRRQHRNWLLRRDAIGSPAEALLAAMRALHHVLRHQNLASVRDRPRHHSPLDVHGPQMPFRLCKYTESAWHTLPRCEPSPTSVAGSVHAHMKGKSPTARSWTRNHPCKTRCDVQHITKALLPRWRPGFSGRTLGKERSDPIVLLASRARLCGRTAVPCRRILGDGRGLAGRHSFGGVSYKICTPRFFVGETTPAFPFHVRLYRSAGCRFVSESRFGASLLL